MFWGAFSPNPALTVSSLVLIPVIWLLLWRRAEPPVLAFACGMQWFQAAALIFHDNSRGTVLGGDVTLPELAQASWLSLIGVLAVTVGMRLALIGSKPLSSLAIKKEALNLAPPRLFLAYIICFLAGTVLERFTYSYAGLTQAFYGLFNLKWLPAFLLAYAVLVRQTHYRLLAIVVAIEFGSGLLGLFSTFKSVLFVLLVVFLGVQGLKDRASWGPPFVIAAALFVSLLVWTAIKGDYRSFLSQESGQQQVLVSVPQRIEKLTDLLRSLDVKQLPDALDNSIQRLACVELFANCIRTVPASVPYEHGALWLGAFERVFMPRLIFPNKVGVDDSERARHYTGLEISGAEQGTSISMGYMAESYVDFGPWLMFIPVLLLGVFYGLIYRILANHGPSRLLGLAVAGTILAFGANTIETSNIKLIGINTANFLVLGLIYWRFGRYFMDYIREISSRSEPRTRPIPPTLPPSRLAKSRGPAEH